MKRILISLALATGLTACTGGQTSSIPQTSIDPIATSKVQLAMGTANINGIAGTNIVSTLRGQSGLSITFNTPTLSGPLNFAGITAAATSGPSGMAWVKGGPSAAEVAAGHIGATAPALLVPPNQTGGTVPTSARTTLGVYGGLSATGFAQVNNSTSGAISLFAANDLANPVTGAARYSSGESLVPFQVPLYTATPAAAAVALLPWVGPPAFAGATGLGTRDGTYANGLSGAAAGITVLDGVTAGAGTYTMSVIIPTGFDVNGNPTNGTVAATAALTSPGTCIGGCGAPIPAPVVTLGAGGASVAVVLPAGATGAMIFLTDLGTGPATGALNCNPVSTANQATATGGAIKCGGNCYPATVPLNSAAFGPPAVYTLTVTASGTVTLPANLGPRPSTTSTTTPTICSAAQNTAALGAPATGDVVVAQMVAYNYNLPTLVPAINTVQAPAMPTTDADIGVSAPVTVTAP